MRVRAALLALIFVSCGKLAEITAPVDGEPVDSTATFTRVQSEVFTPSCGAVGCHDTLGRQADLVLVAGTSYSQIVNRPSTQSSSLNRVTPGNFADSYLYRKITGIGITGERMPSGGPYLTDAQAALVRNWIRRGAPND